LVIDLTILVLVLLFGMFGAFTGAAKQVAQLVALALAYLCARPIGRLLGPKVSAGLEVPLLFGNLIATVMIFAMVLLTVRFALTQILQRILAGDDPHDRSVDRSLGMFFGGVKILAISYIVLSALVFVESNTSIAGKRLKLSAKDSLSFDFARKFNLFEMTQFAPARDLVAIAKSLQSPDQARKLAEDPAFRALQGDARFRQVMNDAELMKAIERGDHRALLRSNPAFQLVQDPTIAARLSAAARASEE
jgi:membrane protein required for colicin V production